MTRFASIRAGVFGSAMLAAGLLCGGSGSLAHAQGAAAPKTASCAPAGGASFICGVNNVEDFAPIPHSRWMIGSDLAPPNTQGTLYLFDTGVHKAKAVDSASITVKQDDKTYGECPGASDFRVFG